MLFFGLIFFSCVAFIRWFVLIIFIAILPLRLVCSAVYLPSTRQVHCGASRRYRRRLLDSHFHSLYVFSVFGFLLFIFYTWCVLPSPLFTKAHNLNYPFSLLTSFHTRLSVHLSIAITRFFSHPYIHTN